jgi:hypothetical protein
VLLIQENPINNIIYSENISVARDQVNILNRFRFTYYVLKFKQRFIACYLRSKRMNYVRLFEGTNNAYGYNNISNITVDDFGFYYLLNENICKEIVSFV